MLLPAPAGPLLLQEQPHPIVYAELAYRWAGTSRPFAFSLFRTRITTCYPYYRVETGPLFRTKITTCCCSPSQGAPRAARRWSSSGPASLIGQRRSWPPSHCAPRASRPGAASTLGPSRAPSHSAACYGARGIHITTCYGSHGRPPMLPGMGVEGGDPGNAMNVSNTLNSVYENT